MENNNKNSDDIRFNKLYELLGEDVNSIYNNQNNQLLFSQNDQVFKDIFNDTEEIIPNNDNIIIDSPSENIGINNDNLSKTVFNSETDGLANNDIFNEEKDIFIVKNENNNGKFEYNKNRIRNKTIINDKNIYDDIDDIYYQKKSIIDYLTNKKALTILAVLTLIAVCILAIKAFHFGKVVDIYNEYVTETDKELDDNTKIYGNEYIDSETLKNVAAAELINCINSNVDTNNLPDNLTSVIKEINDYYKSSNKYFSFAYKDIFTGFTVSYNENGNVFAASTIKAPVNIYLYEMASLGKINLDEELTYTSGYYNNGTGVLKNKPVNTNYSVRTLSGYAIINSDNAAHNMLMDKYGRNNIKTFWSDLGTNTILTGNDNWGLINAHDAMIYMKELYTFYINDSEYGNELMNNFLNTKTKFITGKNDYKIANKSGWSGSSQHDVSIVFSENPYIVVALSNLGYDNNYMNHFNRVNDLTYKLHTEYWKYKMSICNNIRQY